MEKGFFLGIETSSEVTGIAIVKEVTILYELRCLTGSKHNETIFSLLSDALKFIGVTIKDLSGIGVAIGPGMFTSLRVGLALAKGLALPYRLPVKGINTLDALAGTFPKSRMGIVIPIIDARKGEVFTAFYQNGERTSDYLILSPEKLAQVITQNYPNESITLIGNGLRSYLNLLTTLLPQGFDPILLEAPLPSIIALKARESIIQGEFSDVATLQPFYLRPTDAELKRQKATV
uniref:tRNA (Adenosine(37)-N6)-threonylcarbamoyltransferase complex dimerization subunit type 1 TsaB n=1 Tax=candidate division WOR-3 bacterium TaxID=2052148 RepID=A0A7C6EBI2_UNCW3